MLNKFSIQWKTHRDRKRHLYSGITTSKKQFLLWFCYLSNNHTYISMQGVFLNGTGRISLRTRMIKMPFKVVICFCDVYEILLPGKNMDIKRQHWAPVRSVIAPYTLGPTNGLFTLRGTGTGTGKGTKTIGDNGSCSCPCNSAVWTVNIIYRNPLILVPSLVLVPVPVPCSVNAPLQRFRLWASEYNEQFSLLQNR